MAKEKVAHFGIILHHIISSSSSRCLPTIYRFMNIYVERLLADLTSSCILGELLRRLTPYSECCEAGSTVDGVEACSRFSEFDGSHGLGDASICNAGSPDTTGGIPALVVRRRGVAADECDGRLCAARAWARNLRRWRFDLAVLGVLVGHGLKPGRLRERMMRSIWILREYISDMTRMPSSCRD